MGSVFPIRLEIGDRLCLRHSQEKEADIIFYRASPRSLGLEEAVRIGGNKGK